MKEAGRISDSTPPSGRPRLSWLDGMKGIGILWIAFFHFFGTYTRDAFPSPLHAGYFEAFREMCAPTSHLGEVDCLVRGLLVAVVRIGFHAVAVFLVLSGFGLTYALAKEGDPRDGWLGWYRKRLLRLFPMYWVAHLLYLVSPFVARPESIDYRFVLSLLGDRIYPIYTIFYYMNPALWFFGLLLQLYLVFPILYRALRRLGPARFLALCGVLTLGIRYVLIFVLQAHGAYIQGAFFGSRLGEFAAGMALGALYRQHPEETQRRLFSPAGLLAGAAIYWLGALSNRSDLSYAATDTLTGVGLFVILAHAATWSRSLPRFGAVLEHVGVYSYGLYLIHQPYVTYFAELMQRTQVPMAAAVPLAWTGISLLTAACIPLERAVNRLTDRVLDGRRTRPAP